MRTAIGRREFSAGLMMAGAALAAGPSRAARSQRGLRVMSFNVRLPIASDGPNRWEARRDLFVETIRRASSRLDPPTISNILAIAAPRGGFGAYSRGEIEGVLITAFSGFRAAVLESRRVAAEDHAFGVRFDHLRNDLL